MLLSLYNYKKDTRMLRHKNRKYANDADREVPFHCWIGIHGRRFFNFSTSGTQTVCNECLLILEEW